MFLLHCTAANQLRIHSGGTDYRINCQYHINCAGMGADGCKLLQHIASIVQHNDVIPNKCCSYLQSCSYVIMWKVKSKWMGVRA